jgi:hypothetical protein
VADGPTGDPSTVEAPTSTSASVDEEPAERAAEVPPETTLEENR